MNSADDSRDVIGEGIETLQRRHGPFPVNQTTLSLSPPAYDSAVERANEGVADVYVRVRNDDGEVLQVEADGTHRVLRGVGEGRVLLADRARDAVREQAGIDCRIDEITRVTIAGVRNAGEQDAETVYRLLVLFEATHESGHVEDGRWQPESELHEFV